MQLPIMDPSLLKTILPIGYKFMPSDQILLEAYLFNKIHGFPYSQAVVFDCDLYGSMEPWDIWNSFEGVDGQDLYFFTKLKRSVTKSGHVSAHINRKIGLADGTWSGENSATPISPTGQDDQIMGYCKRFRYENPKSLEHHGEWIMHEYSLHQSFVMPNCTDSNFVLCRLKKNERLKKRKASSSIQYTKKRVMAPVTNHSTMKNNDEKSTRKVDKIQQSEKQKVVTSTIITNISCEPKITTNEGDSDLLSAAEMYEETSGIRHCSHEMTDLILNKDVNENMNIMLDIPQVTIKEIELLEPNINANQLTKEIELLEPNINANEENNNLVLPGISELTSDELELWVSDWTTNDFKDMFCTDQMIHNSPCSPGFNMDDLELWDQNTDFIQETTVVP